MWCGKTHGDRHVFLGGLLHPSCRVLHVVMWYNVSGELMITVDRFTQKILIRLAQPLAGPLTYNLHWGTDRIEWIRSLDLLHTLFERTKLIDPNNRIRMIR